jgi:hypothetical protein
MEWVESQPDRERADALVRATQADAWLAGLYRANPGSYLSYTLYDLRVASGDSIGDAAVEFWRRILTDGRRQATGYSWDALAFRAVPRSGWIQAWFAGRDGRRSVPALFQLSCERFRAEYQALQQQDGEVTEEAENRLLQSWYGLVCQAVRLEPARHCLAEWGKERPVRAVGEYLEGWSEMSLCAGEAEQGPAAGRPGD